MSNEYEMTRAERVRLSALSEAIGSYGVMTPKTDVILSRAAEFEKFLKQVEPPQEGKA